MEKPGFWRRMGRSAIQGGLFFNLWSAVLLAGMIWGFYGYGRQLRLGLDITGMTDQVMWGLYIGNFTFWVGVAASAVILVAPAYLFGRDELKGAVLIGEAMAVSAVTMSLLFVLADLGGPFRIWHALPLLGSLNFPTSVMAWDMLVLTLYLLLNLGLWLVLLRARHQGRALVSGRLLFWILLAILLGVSIHAVTAFLLAGLPARPHWHSSLLAPRFIASAFAAGAALMILLFQGMRRFGRAVIPVSAIDLLGLIMAASLAITLFFLCSDAFLRHYRPSGFAEAALQAHLAGGGWLAGWSAAANALLAAATLLVLIPVLRRRSVILSAVSALTFIGVWMEKGIGLIVTGFLPTSLGEMGDYAPTLTEIQVSVGIWATGALLFTVMARASAAVWNAEWNTSIPCSRSAP